MLLYCWRLDYYSNILTVFEASSNQLSCSFVDYVYGLIIVDLREGTGSVVDF